MAKLSLINREKKRARLVEKYAAKRAHCEQLIRVKVDECASGRTA